MGKIKHLQKRSDFQFLGARPYNVASIAPIPGKNDHAAGFLIPERLAYDGVNETHVYVLLGSIPQALVVSRLTLQKLAGPHGSTGCDGQVNAD
jgi:hypothetical protein